MPKTLKQLAGAQRNVKKAGGKKIDFKPIAQAIIASNQYYTVKEVHEGVNMVNKQVTRFRTMKLLNAQVAGKRMDRYLLKGAFYYGAPKK